MERGKCCHTGLRVYEAAGRDKCYFAGAAHKGEGPCGEKCPHCYREFTNLRHHVNQQHIQVKTQII